MNPMSVIKPVLTPTQIAHAMLSASFLSAKVRAQHEGA
jgi:hypothetical protein